MNINKNYLFLLEEIIKKNFASKYKGSVLGILWSVIKPLLIMIIMTIIFSTLFKRSIDNYPVYILSGKCLYDFFNLGSNSGLYAIRSNKFILKTTSASKSVFVIGGVLSEVINLFITLIILFGVMLVTHAPFYFDKIILSIIPLISLAIMILGMGLILSICSVYYSDVQHLWGVVTQMGMYASAIFYPMDIIPEPFHQYMILNPIFWAIDQFRSFVMLGTIPSTIYILNLLIFSLIILVMGIIIFKKYENKVTMKL
ncbi:ABC transporter permease [uncultured Methanobrevibacter sp.]|uniref:ABC transporter permease n=1 Tax=uncultured Methanobrevibacter sp. TaxID=253161 RepID=UPI002636F15F|nr:ABC transporter permease [uncultured Methanobrevibacter sp.]